MRDALFLQHANSLPLHWDLGKKLLSTCSFYPIPSCMWFCTLAYSAALHFPCVTAIKLHCNFFTLQHVVKNCGTIPKTVIRVKRSPPCFHTALAHLSAFLVNKLINWEFFCEWRYIFGCINTRRTGARKHLHCMVSPKYLSRWEMSKLTGVGSSWWAL